MNKILLSTVLAAGLLIGFSGCAKDVQIQKNKSETSNYRNITVNRTGALTHAGRINETNTKLLQVAAEETIVSGYQYFSFENVREPFVYDINSSDEFLEKCASKGYLKNFGMAFVPFGDLINSDPCTLYNSTMGFGTPAKSSAGFTLHKEKPEMPAFNARTVLENLKFKKLYEDNTDGVEYIVVN